MAPPAAQGARVLSIQSHTVHGHVGNKSAVFPLQLLEFDVDFINSVQFSNHTGYGKWKGSVVSGEQLWELIEGLEGNGICTYTHLLTGYIASVSFLETIVRVLEKLRTYNPDLVYVCDPVMGDEGILYIPAELVPVYRQRMPSIASVLTPNAFEAENLTGIQVTSTATALEACAKLHEQGTTTVVVTSLDDNDAPGMVTMVASTRAPQVQGAPQQLRVRVPSLPYHFTGTGDLFACLLLAWTSIHPDNLKLAVSKVVGGLQGVLKETSAHAEKATITNGSLLAARGQPGRTPEVCRALELRLVHSQQHIKAPSIEALSVEAL